MKKNFKKVSKTFLATFVIFQLTIAAAATPVVALAFDAGGAGTSASAKQDPNPRGGGTKDDPGKTKPTKGDSSGVVHRSSGLSASARAARVLGASTTKAVVGGSCDPEANLLTNGGFEDPTVSGSWDIYTTIPGWTISWISGAGNGSVANFELQTSDLWTPNEGDQYIELDSDFDGPTGTINNESAGTAISQEITTVPGVTYTVKFNMSARPGTSIGQNGVQVLIDGVPWGAPYWRDGSGNTDTDWATIELTFTAQKSTTVIEFAYAFDGAYGGASDSFGTFLDNISVNCNTPEEPETGSIEICKVIVDGNDVVVDGDDYEDETFTIHLRSADGKWYTDVVFTAPLAANATIGQGNDTNMQCKTVSDLPLGEYYYDEEVASGPTNWDVAYTEGDVSDPLDGTQVFAYDYSYINGDVTDESDPDGNRFANGFIDLGSISYGNTARVVVVNHERDGGSCLAPLYARINIQDNATKWRNWGEGDMALNVYVGGSDEAHRHDIGEWFPLTDNNGNFINDADIAGYRDVPGLAVQRIDGALRVVLYGGHASEAVGKELASGSIELSGDQSTRLLGAWTVGDDGFIDPIDNDPYTGLRLHDASVNDPENTLDSRNGFNGYINQYNPRFDNLRTIYGLFQFHMVVTTGSDGFYARYDYTPVVNDDCDNGGNDDESPVIEVNPLTVCIETSATSYDFLGGVSATDLEDDANSIPLVIEHNGNTVIFGTPGSYTVTYSVTDSDGNSTTASRTINIAEDCDDGNGGGGNHIPTITLDPVEVCLATEDSVYNWLDGVTVADDEDDANSIPLTVSHDGDSVVIFGTTGIYIVTYSVTDSDDAIATATRTITISDNNCGNTSNGGGGGGSITTTGGTSGGGRAPQGEVLGASVGPACIKFTEYHNTGDAGGEVSAIQTFLNDYMNAGLTVDGVYGRATTQAVHDFQAKHWNEIIDPWNPPLSANTTGWWYKTTETTANAIMGCPSDTVYLEDPQIDYTLTEVASASEFSKDATVASLEAAHNLASAQ